MRIVCIGDIGVTNRIIHIGDEAMFDEMVTQLRRRGVNEIVGLSSDPEESAARYSIRAIRRIGFCNTADTTRATAEARMDKVLRSAQGVTNLLASNDPAWAVIDAVRSSDGVAIAGGGNLASTWPTHIFERVTFGALARLFSKPLVVSGQTLGPYLSPEDETLVAQLLNSASMVGLRERPSYDYALRLGIPEAKISHTVDDASFLGIDVFDGTSTVHAANNAAEQGDVVEPLLPEDPYCVVSLAGHINGEDPDLFATRMAELLDHVATSTGLDIVFFAHWGSTDAAVSAGDTPVHERVQARMTAPFSTVVPTMSVGAATLARNAALSISLRYHPAVFAVSASVPTIGIAVDDYTTTKLTGALGNFGQSSVLPLASLLAGEGAGLVDFVWASRAAIAEAGAALAPEKRQGSAQWWESVAATFTGPTGDGPTPPLVRRQLI
ncbi:MAG: polysaccharide pyruvyl transferase family protein [Glaciihabitans sp.]|nr:polysaccharide pyruvyl transferase family protein [Glaciihabitans sp.]